MTVQLLKRTKAIAAACPFCGEEDDIELCNGKNSTAVFYWWQCYTCEACGPASCDASDALRLWNRRWLYGDGVEENTNDPNEPWNKSKKAILNA